MQYRAFPGSDVRASVVGFGTWTLATGWWGSKTDAEAVALLRQSLDEHGMTFFDAADAYGNGRAERQLADAFRGRRGEVVYATKVGYDLTDAEAIASRRGQAELPMRTDPVTIRRAVDRCLERLETDYIDVLQIHNAKMEHVRDPALWGTLRDLQREGKVRVWGAAFGPAIGWLHEAVELCQREPDVGAIRMIWNILEQHPGGPMLAAAREYAPHCGFTVRVTHASGMQGSESLRRHGVLDRRPCHRRCRATDPLGDADVMVAGGAEAAINRLVDRGLLAMTALSTRFNDEPTRASRPCDRDRDGFVMGEGAGIVVLEELEHARRAARRSTPR